jgi:hypothetical protein
MDSNKMVQSKLVPYVCKKKGHTDTMVNIHISSEASKILYSDGKR